jgi:integrase
LKPNHRQVQAAKAVDGKRTRYMIQGVQGLMLDVAPRGSRYWYVRYQMPGLAKRTFRFYRIGNARSISLADAVKRAGKVLHQVEYDGRDPYQERLEPVLTVAGLIDEFLTRHVRPKLAAETLKQYEYRLKAFVEPEIGSMDAADVRKRDILELGDAIAEDGKRERKSSGRGSKGGDREGGAPRLADAIVEIVCSMYSWAQKRDLLENNPAFRVAKYAERARRQRVLRNPEVPKFWSGVEHPKVGTELTSILRLLLVTGQRRGEVAGARVEEFRLDGNDPACVKTCTDQKSLEFCSNTPSKSPSTRHIVA